MAKKYKQIASFLKNEAGQSLTEYALIIAFIALAVVIVLALFGINLLALYQFIINTAFPL